MIWLLIYSLALVTAPQVFAIDRIDPSAVSEAIYDEDNKELRGAIAVKLQILLDRANNSPGQIDGHIGENVRNAIKMFEEQSGLPVDGKLDPEVWELLGGSTRDVLVPYNLTAEDLEGPFVKTIPSDFAEMAQMQRLSYTGPAELLSEKFHIHPELLKALNPNARLEEPGEQIMVPNVLDTLPEEKVASIEIDKTQGLVRGYSADGMLVVSYPASIGGRQNPSPHGTMAVKSIVENPMYPYRPDKNFQQGNNTQPLDLPPGPNNPVGSIWIDLTKETYGIHGTPEPEFVGKKASHGCVRLTNWDVEELAKLVKPGTRVNFTN
jgi:lipoprotein-anchoring transpeptidase ErfK/SrfK